MSDEPSPAKLTDEFSSKASDPRAESHMSHEHHRKSLRQHRADLHGHGKNHSDRHKDSEPDGHSNGSDHEDHHPTHVATDVTPAHDDGARLGVGKLLLLVCVAQLMVILDITAVNVADRDEPSDRSPAPAAAVTDSRAACGVRRREDHRRRRGEDIASVR